MALVKTTASSAPMHRLHLQAAIAPWTAVRTCTVHLDGVWHATVSAKMDAQRLAAVAAHATAASISVLVIAVTASVLT